MPLYEYQCTKCGEKFEVRQPIGEDGSRLNCPSCKTGKPQKLISTFSSTSSGGYSGIGSSCSPFSGGT
ncbi:MAG: zinc ribbon domain-containing protein [Chloroflexota bacterium]|nr:zinc ribbon domain-containing protein [Chloroflexota bacterium]